MGQFFVNVVSTCVSSCACNHLIIGIPAPTAGRLTDGGYYPSLIYGMYFGLNACAITIDANALFGLFLILLYFLGTSINHQKKTLLFRSRFANKDYYNLPLRETRTFEGDTYL